MFQSVTSKLVTVNRVSKSFTEYASKKYHKVFSISIDDYLRPNGLLWHNLESYIGLETEMLKKRSKFYKIYQFCIILFHFLSVCRWFSLWFAKNSYLQQVMLDIGVNTNAPRVYFIILLCIWSSFCLWVSILWYWFQDKGPLAFMNPFVAIKFPMIHLDPNLTPEMIEKLKKRFKIGVFIARLSIQSSNGVAIILWLVLPYIANGEIFINWVQFIYIIHSQIWSQYAASALYYTFFVFHLTCYMFALQLQKLHQDFKKILTESKTTIKARIDEITNVMKNYQLVCENVNKCNQFWQIFLLGAYFVYITLVTLLLYVVLYTSGNEFNRIALGAKLIISIVCLTFLAFSGDIVSRKGHLSYGEINSIANRFKFPLALQLKVNSCVEILGAGRSLTGKSRRVPTCGTVGFSCSNLFVIKDDNYIEILTGIASYFMLFIEMFQYGMHR